MKLKYTPAHPNSPSSQSTPSRVFNRHQIPGCNSVDPRRDSGWHVHCRHRIRRGAASFRNTVRHELPRVDSRRESALGDTLHQVLSHGFPRILAQPPMRCRRPSTFEDHENLRHFAQRRQSAAVSDPRLTLPRERSNFSRPFALKGFLKSTARKAGLVVFRSLSRCTPPTRK